ncbi:hypothetical protein [Grimontia celer]|nr:hypothetical protein [Grimontia celer]
MAVWLRYQFYFLCGILTVLSVYQYCGDEENLDRVFLFCGVLLILNLAIGFLESLSLIRYPLSPYSKYIGYFGYNGVALGDITEHVLNVISTKPTGFNYNPNNFGFVTLLIAPFLFFHKQKAISFIGMAVCTWILVAIGSKAHFIAFLCMLLFLPFYYKNILIRVATVFAIMAVFLVLLALPYIIDLSSVPTLSRMYSSVEHLRLGMSLIISGDIDPTYSTAKRAFTYAFGLKELFDTNGFGVGFGGIEARLTEMDFKIKSFHFFFLQLLVDFGVYFFVIFIVLYFSMIEKLRRLSLRISSERISYYSKSASLSLFVAIPASLAPSGVHYILTYYLIIGFALSILKVGNKYN